MAAMVAMMSGAGTAWIPDLRRSATGRRRGVCPAGGRRRAGTVGERCATGDSLTIGERRATGDSLTVGERCATGERQTIGERCATGERQTIRERWRDLGVEARRCGKVRTQPALQARARPNLLNQCAEQGVELHRTSQVRITAAGSGTSGEILRFWALVEVNARPEQQLKHQ